MINNATEHGLDPIEVTVKLVEGSSMEVVVSDTGPGLHAEDREIIWEPFVSHNSTGQGLGLFVVQQQAHALEGSCGVRSNSFGGSSFWFRIPYRPTTTAHTPIANEHLNNAAALVRQMAPAILLIDDTLSVLELHAEELRGFNCKVDIACGGVEGLSCMKAKKYNLVLCDFKMPSQNGAEVTAEFREWEAKQIRLPLQTIYGLSAYHERVMAECLDSGMQGVLPKPMQVSSVLKLLTCNP